MSKQLPSFTERRRSRRKDIRRPRPALKLHVEPLETRWLLSADARRPRPEPGPREGWAASLALALESLLESRSNAATFARNLAQHPRLANDLGLGGLSLALRQHAGYAPSMAGGRRSFTSWTRIRATQPSTI